MQAAKKPLITLPVRVLRLAQKRHEKLRLQELEESGTQYPKGRRDLPPIIACRRKELNFYREQRQNPFKKMATATEHWASRKVIGDYFAFTPYRSKLSTNWFDHIVSQKTMEKLESKKPTFASYDLDPRLQLAMNTMSFKHPTNIQAAALPVLLEGDSSIVAAETGNGKTLAFLLPLLHRTMRLKDAALKMEAEMKSSEVETLGSTRLLRPNRPLAVVVAPGRELAHQIYEVARDVMSASAKCEEAPADSDDRSFKGLGLFVRLALGGNTAEKIETGVRRPTDVLIGTAGVLNKMFKERFYRSGSVHTLVFDEADTLLDDTFASVTKSLLTRLTRNSSDGPAAFGDSQLVFVGATFPKSIEDAVGGIVDSDQLKLIRTGQLHRVPTHIYQKFIRVPKTGRVDYLMEVIEPDLQKKRPVLIFSNKSTTSNFLSHCLRGKGVDCDTFNSSMYWRTRYQTLERFKAGQLNVLSCTDLASRGIDITNVHHLVNYDFPSNASDYLHRIGRVGRASSKCDGKVTNLVCGQQSIALVQELEESVRLHREISDVDANVARLIGEKYRDAEAMPEEPDQEHF